MSSAWQQSLDDALSVARSGYAVFPLSRGKVPAIRSPHQAGHGCKGCEFPGHGVYDATTDPARIRFLWDAAPRAAGYGIACGGRRRLVGLDLDRKNGVDGVVNLRQRAAEHGFVVPRTTTVCTPSGGFHLWFTAPDGVDVPNSAGRVAPGIDVRGSGGYLVGPGSRGRAGAYCLHPRTCTTEVQSLPDGLLRLMKPPPPRSIPRRRPTPGSNAGDAALNGLLRVVLTSGEGQRNDRLYWAACKAWAHVADGHLDAAQAESALVDAAVSRGLPEADARRTYASARRTAGAAV